MCDVKANPATTYMKMIAHMAALMMSLVVTNVVLSFPQGGWTCLGWDLRLNYVSS